MSTKYSYINSELNFLLFAKIGVLKVRKTVMIKVDDGKSKYIHEQIWHFSNFLWTYTRFKFVLVKRTQVLLIQHQIYEHSWWNKTWCINVSIENMWRKNLIKAQDKMEIYNIIVLHLKELTKNKLKNKILTVV